MRNFLYYVAGFIIVIWALFFTLHILGFVVHALLVIAAVVFLIQLAARNRPSN